MSRQFKLTRDYYEEKKYLYRKKTIEINPGVTVLVGCNGIGKTTLLQQLANQLKKDNIPYISFDNLRDGGSKAISEASFYGDFSFMATAITSSEGENIVMNMGKLAAHLYQFIETGENPKDAKCRRLAKAMRRAEGIEEDNPEVPAERWILLDAVDSGLSVDNIVDMKEYLFKTILEHNCGNVIHIVISANEYEMARGEQCFDVHNGKYVEIKDYEDYRNLILKSRKQKDKRDGVEDLE